MQYRTLGANGPRVSAIGLGCMGMSAFYGAHDDSTSIKTLHLKRQKILLRMTSVAQIPGSWVRTSRAIYVWLKQ